MTKIPRVKIKLGRGWLPENKRLLYEYNSNRKGFQFLEEKSHEAAPPGGCYKMKCPHCSESPHRAADVSSRTAAVRAAARPCFSLQQASQPAPQTEDWNDISFLF